MRCGVLRSTVALEPIEGLNNEKAAPWSLPRCGLRLHEAEAAVQQTLSTGSGLAWAIHGIGTDELKSGLKV